jgi:hypothetical protein
MQSFGSAFALWLKKYFICPIWPNHYKKPLFMFMRNYKEILPWEGFGHYNLLKDTDHRQKEDKVE